MIFGGSRYNQPKATYWVNPYEVHWHLKSGKLPLAFERTITHESWMMSVSSGIDEETVGIHVVMFVWLIQCSVCQLLHIEQISINVCKMDISIQYNSWNICACLPISSHEKQLMKQPNHLNQHLTSTYKSIASKKRTTFQQQIPCEIPAICVVIKMELLNIFKSQIY